MRSVGIVAYCVGLALLLAGCDPNDRNYFRGGVGTELYTADVATVTELQNVYLDNLCRQSSSYVGADVPSCSQQVIPTGIWPLIVQAGMNDIDQRCDAYLSWLDQKKRENGAILSEIGAIRVAVDALTNPALVSSVSPVGLAAVAAAFGLATSTLGNVNSLLLQVDHTTVQYVVFNNRRVFREDLLKLSSSINNKPAAVHSLRTYLNICMPMTIAANINATVTVFQQATPGETIKINPLISTSTIGKPLSAGDTIQKQVRPNLPVVPEPAEIFDPYDPNKQSVPYFKSTQRALCVPDAEIGSVGPATRSLIRIYEATKSMTLGAARKTRDNGKLDSLEAEEVRVSSGCAATGPRNFFEQQLFSDTDRGRQNLAEFAGRLNKVPGIQVQLGDTLDSLRKSVALARQDAAVAPKLTLDLPQSMLGQVTPDLYFALPK